MSLLRWGVICLILNLFWAQNSAAEQNVFHKLFSGETFIISNFPEEIIGPGLIFDKQLSTQSLRVLYHHKNITDTIYHYFQFFWL